MVEKPLCQDMTQRKQSEQSSKIIGSSAYGHQLDDLDIGLSPQRRGSVVLTLGKVKFSGVQDYEMWFEK